MTVSLPRRLLTLLPLLGVPGVSRAAGEDVVIVGSERGGAYQEAADALMAELERGGVAQRAMRYFTLAELEALQTTPKLYVALGTEASAALARREVRIPLLCTLLPRVSFERIARDSGRRPSGHFSALYLSQPPERTLDLIRLALPQARRVGVLWSEESRSQLPALEEAARARGLRVLAAPVRPEEPVFTALKKVLEDVDVLLAMPDPNIYNSGSIQNILLASYRAHVPLVAFSAAYVRAGALIAVHSSPAQLGVQAAQLTRALLQGRGGWPPPQGPQEFSVSLNEPVARSLGLSLDAVALTERLRRLERLP